MGFRRRDDNPYHLDDSEPNVKPPLITVALLLYIRYKIHCSSFTFIHDLRINLRCADIAMAEQL